MITDNYPVAVKKELLRLAVLINDRMGEKHMKDISALVTEWEKGEISVSKALSTIQDLSFIRSIEWSEGADPGMPVAHAIVEGYLVPEDVSKKTWLYIEPLITLVEI